MVKQQQNFHSQIKNRVGNFLTRKLTSPKLEEMSPLKKESPRPALSNIGSEDESQIVQSKTGTQFFDGNTQIFSSPMWKRTSDLTKMRIDPRVIEEN